jgi:hypothetical protein
MRRVHVKLILIKTNTKGIQMSDFFDVVGERIPHWATNVPINFEFRIPDSEFQPPTTYHLPPTTYYLLPTTYYLPPTTNHLLPTTNHLLLFPTFELDKRKA